MSARSTFKQEHALGARPLRESFFVDARVPAEVPRSFVLPVARSEGTSRALAPRQPRGRARASYPPASFARRPSRSRAARGVWSDPRRRRARDAATRARSSDEETRARRSQKIDSSRASSRPSPHPARRVASGPAASAFLTRARPRLFSRSRRQAPGRGAAHPGQVSGPDPGARVPFQTI
jgi:hypothetical protein